MRPWLKAGLIGAAVLAGLAVLTLVPLAAACCCIAWPVVYLGVGLLAGYFVPPVRDSGAAAGQGALAAVLAQLLGGIVYTAVLMFQSATTDMSQAMAEMIQMLQSAGLDTTALESALEDVPAWMTGTGGGLLSGLAAGGTCLVGGLVVAAVLGALGGLIFASAKRE
ncbi:MAG TPA: hypothetical protein PKO09_12655 [Anaerolineae bacterium]|nr:hypothetical protein [Anaerolineae bacterium]